MAQLVEPGPGVCLAFGASNAREGICSNGDVLGFKPPDATPEHPDLFFNWMARKVLNAAEAGYEWLVAGFPGPVSDDGEWIGPFANIGGMREGEYNVRENLAAADPAAGRLLEDEGFVIVNSNDGPLAAHAAEELTEHEYDVVAALISGSGFGAGVTKRASAGSKLYITQKLPFEIGHYLLDPNNPEDTLENRCSGTAINNKYGDPRELPANHVAWVKEAEGVQIACSVLGIVGGAEVVVPTGGVGAGAYDKYMRHIETFNHLIAKRGNGVQKKFMPALVRVPEDEVARFELRGAEGVMRERLSVAA